MSWVMGHVVKIYVSASRFFVNASSSVVPVVSFC